MARLFKVSIPTSVIVLVLSEIVLLFGCYVAAAYWLPAYPSAEFFLVEDNGLWRIGFVAGIVVFGLVFQRSLRRLPYNLPGSAGAADQRHAGRGFCAPGGSELRAIQLSAAQMDDGRRERPAVLVALPAWRVLFVDVVSRGLGAQRLLFLGGSQAVREIIAQRLAKRGRTWD